MPTITLRHLCYTQLDTLSWCVTAQIVTPQQPYNKRQQQRGGVRQLLQHLLDKLEIIDRLEDTHFPYRLGNSGHYVCFSHSGNKVAVVISARRAVGIDIEVQEVAWHVAQRFYHPGEIAILATLAHPERTIICRVLWQLKESFIKIYHYKLAQGLAMSYAPFIPDLMASIKKDPTSLLIIDHSNTDYQIALLPLQQTVIVF